MTLQLTICQIPSSLMTPVQACKMLKLTRLTNVGKSCYYELDDVGVCLLSRDGEEQLNEANPLSIRELAGDFIFIGVDQHVDEELLANKDLNFERSSHVSKTCEDNSLEDDGFLSQAEGIGISSSHGGDLIVAGGLPLEKDWLINEANKSTREELVGPNCSDGLVGSPRVSPNHAPNCKS
ncbi:hypothetical protein COLO4_33358 [Corchorus olitorius]|uniref:Uncharacterized protein n=1 Tax=Corchorus olitorius TaxID=93759 RepID=A0A1R3GUL6_9ROSI|nr:hypothetical protein COLO4_33358 [Corchorus olitorius]